MTVTTTEPTAVPAARATPAKKTAAKQAPAKTTAATKAAEAEASDAKLVTHSRETEVAALIERGWSKAALTRQPEVAGTTVLWRLDRLTGPDVAKVDAMLRRLDEDKVEPPTRKASGGGRTSGPSRAVLSARVADAESRLDVATSAKTVKELREAIAAALETLRGDQPQAQGD
jgi:hypothetical protein